MMRPIANRGVQSSISAIDFRRSEFKGSDEVVYGRPVICGFEATGNHHRLVEWRLFSSQRKLRDCKGATDVQPSIRSTVRRTRLSSMIRHIVFFTARHNGNFDIIREGLTLLTRIPDALRLEIALNRKSDPMSKEVDVIVYGEFADDAALAAYKSHEFYAEAIRLVRPLRELRLAADYYVDEAICRSHGQD